MLSRETHNSSYQTSLNCHLDGLLSILAGRFARRTPRSCSHPHHNAESVQIVSQIPQPHLGFCPHQTNHSPEQPSGPLGLHPKNMFDPAPDSGTCPISPNLSVRQFFMPASLSLKVFTISPLLQLTELFLRAIGRVRPNIPTTVVFIQKGLKNLTVMDRSRRFQSTTFSSLISGSPPLPSCLKRICQSKSPVCIIVHPSALNSMSDHNTMTVTLVAELANS